MTKGLRFSYIFQVEQFRAGSPGEDCSKKIICFQCFQQRRIDPSLPGQGSIAVKFLLEIQPGSSIDQRITGTGIRYEDCLWVQGTGQEGEISDTSHIEHDAVFSLLRKDAIIPVQGQWGAFASCGNMFLPEIADRDDPGTGCNMVAVAYLQGCIGESCQSM